jgi:Tol biopolymer transport system component
MASAGGLFLDRGKIGNSQMAYATFPNVNGKIAFTSQRDGNREIYSMNADGSNQIRLTHNPSFSDEAPDWSPDGKKIAYVCNNTAVCVMNADGTGSVQIVSSNVNSNPAWSPDGKKIAFDRLYNGVDKIHVVNADGSGDTALAGSSGLKDHDPDWSPDGTKIAFSLPGGIDIMNSDGTGAVFLTSGQNPSWSPDGTRIAFASNGNIATIRLDGSGLVQITSTGLDDWPSWSPDGTKLVFDRYVPGTVESFQTYIINADGSSGGTATKLSIGSNIDRFPDFGPLPQSQQQQVTLTVNSKDTSGNTISGYWTVLYDGNNGSVQKTGFTPAIFTLTAGLPYQIGVGNYGSYYFDHWEDNNSANNPRTVSFGANAVLTAVYRTTPLPPPPPNTYTLTVRSVDATGNTITGYWTVLYDANGSILKTGFTPAYFGLNSGQQYRIGMGNYGSYYFDHWQDSISGTNPRNISINGDTSLTAVYRTTP